MLFSNFSYLNEFKTIINKSLTIDNQYFFLSPVVRQRNYSRIKLMYRRKCLITKRNKGHFRVFQLSRNQIRFLGCAGLLPGLRKSS